MNLLDRYKEACNYPGRLDEAAVDGSLKEYLAALGIKREVMRITRPWCRVPGLTELVAELAADVRARSGGRQHGNDALDAIAARDALDALDARAAIDASAASAAIDARAARAALDARAAIAASAAIAAGAASAASAASAARDARAARDAIDASAASAAIDARAAIDAIDASAAIDAIDASAASAASAARDARNARNARAARAARAALDARAASAASAASAARDARNALDARDASDASAASAILLREFGNWALMRGGYWWWEISWVAATHIGAVQLKMLAVAKWTLPVFEAYCAGVWYLVWTPTTLYWVAKPTVHVETGSFGRRLHCEDGPACANDVENLYFLHGILVPAYVVVKPEFITLDEIKAETNEEMRRILIERFGWERYLREAGAKQRHRRFNDRDGQWETLYQLDDGTQRIVLADPSTARRYALGVPREIAKCEEAQDWITHGLDRRAVHRS